MTWTSSSWPNWPHPPRNCKEEKEVPSPWLGHHAPAPPSDLDVERGQESWTRILNNGARKLCRLNGFKIHYLVSFFPGGEHSRAFSTQEQYGSP